MLKSVLAHHLNIVRKTHFNSTWLIYTTTCLMSLNLSQWSHNTTYQEILQRVWPYFIFNCFPKLIPAILVCEPAEEALGFFMTSLPSF